MKKTLLVGFLLIAAFWAAAPASAHFGMIIPDKNLMERPGEITLEYRFWHPMENSGMSLVKPKAAGVALGEERADLLASLKEQKEGNATLWSGSYQVKKPGDYIFYMEPQPYWEPAEDCYIIHYTKTIVDALNAEEGWDQPLGLKMEIVPLTRPYGLWAGNSFTGKVLFKGAPLANADVEVEFYNNKGEMEIPAPVFVTQVVRTDANGVFTFTMPWGGWWGFAALTTDDQKMQKDGKPKNVELGGVLWIYLQPVK
ncbi:ATP-dependent DNA ligase [Desulfocarbo indianensis]|nr:ATP-dependent DNA ligase [Desulfocarbo indianensis]